MDHPSVHAYIHRIFAAHPSITFLRLPPASPSPPPPPSSPAASPSSKPTPLKPLPLCPKSPTPPPSKPSLFCCGLLSSPFAATG
ncbi:hypothetical protein Fmac_021729 [Flemingia macrophylla]|uniref:Uncharacterized protein n=1 Tax=Flemingia macrophylla TaxID=520843 RepID=A0ABD1LXP6_9FABA